jgi:hypothetical protein
MGAGVAHNGIEIERTEEGGSGNTNRAQTLWQVNMPRHAWGELSRGDSRVVLGTWFKCAVDDTVEIGAFFSGLSRKIEVFQ